MPNLAALPMLLAAALAAQAAPAVPADAAAVAPAWERPTPVDRGNQSRIYRFGDCLLEKSSTEVRRMMSALPGSKAELRAIRTLKDDSCRGANESVSFHQWELRGAVAETLYERARAAGDALPSRGPSEAFDTFESRMLSVQAGKDGEVRKQERYGRWLAHCAAATDPLSVHRLLETDLGTAGEQTAFTTLRSAIDGCRGQREYGDFDPVMMRALLAEALFRRSQAGGVS